MMDTTTYKRTLEDRLQELTARAQNIDSDLRQPPDADWEENAVESANDEVLEEIGDLALEEIREIKRALNRIEDGTYGLCTRCGKEIAAKRLEVMPHTAFCIECA